MKRLLYVLPFVAGCAASPAPHLDATAPPERRTGSAPVATEGFRLAWKGDEAPGIADLVREYARVTGQTVLMTQETEAQAWKQVIEKAGGEDVLEVAAEDVQAVTEALLAVHQFVLHPVHDGDPRILQLISLETRERNFVRRNATFVPVEELGAWERRPASLITTVISLPNSDVRTLSNSMRTMLTDANTQQIIPVGNSNALILTGFGHDVCDLVSTLRRIDAESRGPEPVQKATEAR